MWLEKVLEDFNYRDDYLDWYEDLQKSWTRVSVSVCLTSLAAALLLGLLLKCLVLACAFAGASGAALSVLHNQPPVGVYGDVVSGRQAMFIRFVTGIVAAVVGLGLLGSGIVAVGMPQHDGSFVSPASLIHTCTGAGRENDCGSADMLLLLAIGVLLGLTERALTAFQRAVIGGRRGSGRKEGRRQSRAAPPRRA
jgi:prepilin signal peptidase PulO-like enzyme (type II secretory pathway)